jgi:hypothetical protein
MQLVLTNLREERSVLNESVVHRLFKREPFRKFCCSHNFYTTFYISQKSTARTVLFVMVGWDLAVAATVSNRGKLEFASGNTDYHGV